MKGPVQTLAMALALAAAGCASGGGGGGGGSSGPVSPPPAPPPSPPPPPPPPPASYYENIEYNRDYSKALIHASSAYAAGATGAGITIAVIDTGVDVDHAEFAGGKLSTASVDIYQVGHAGLSLPAGLTRTFDDELGHGTGVASAAAGNKLADDDPVLVDAQTNGGFAGMHGVAFDATILAIRADEPDPDCAPGCDCPDPAVAASIDYAVAHGADVINISLGGDEPNGLILDQALRRAVDAGVIIVAAAGNADRSMGETPADDPASPAIFAADPTSDGLAIAVGASKPDGTISDFSYRAGIAQDFYVLAPGQGLVVATLVEECPGTGDTCYNTLAAGTSFASPEVAGAIALLLQGFPSLSRQDAVQILLNSAQDLGDPGVDAIYGHGLIDLEAAFAPIGTTTVSLDHGAGIISAQLLALPPSGATGDWLTASGLLEGAIMRDGYRRAFHVAPETAPATSSAQSDFEAAALGQRLAARRAGFALGGGSFAAAVFRAPDDAFLAHPNLATDASLTPELSISVREGPLSFAMGRGFAAPAALGGSQVSALTPAASTGAIARLASAGDWASLGYDLGSWSLKFRAAGDETRSFSAASLTRRFGGQEAGFEVGAAAEDETAWGGAAGSRLGGADAARTSFAALAWRGAMPLGWRGAARLEAARAALEMPSYVRVLEEPAATAWTLSAEHRLVRGVDLGLTLAQPLRAESGRIAASVPVDVTKANASIYQDRVAALTPSGREIDLETALRFDLAARAQARLAFRLADAPGHVADAPPESAIWLGLRWTR